MSSSPKKPRLWLQIPLEEIVLATNNFGDENLIFEGEFGSVYKAKLLGSGQLGNIVLQRRLNSVYEPWEDEVWKISGFQQDDDMNSISIVGFCDENIIVFKHVELIKIDLSDPTFNWMQRLRTCTHLASRIIYSANEYIFMERILELALMISLGDLMFQVLCGKKAEEQYPTRMAIEHYEKGELEKIMDPNLRLQMHHQSFTIFSKAAYNCIKQPYINNIYHIQKGLEEALILQTKHEKYLKLFFRSTPKTKGFKTSTAFTLPIPFQEIALATNNFGDENLIHKGEFVNVYKGKLLGSGQLGNIIVRRRLDRVYEEQEDVWREYEEDVCWEQVLHLSGDMYANDIPFVGSCDENVIVYEHVGNGILKKDQSNPTFNWMERLDTCIELASRLIVFGGRKIYSPWDFRVSDANARRCKEYFELIYILSLGDLMFEVLCEKKAEEHAIRMAIEAYEKRELEKIMDPNLRLEMHQQSFTIFSKMAYDCIKQPSINNIHDVQKGLQEALKLQREHERYIEHNRIQLSNIMLSTNNFADECCIGSGAYGTVYKAKLDHFDRKSSLVREDVAIKRISKREDGQGDQGFFIELSMLGSCEHPNIISLLGFCYEGSERILVYEYAFKQSLNQHLGSTDNKTILTWAQRIRICLDIAYGLNYLHNNTDDKPRIIHRDVKSDNILLGEKWNAKIADFGLSKYHPVNQHASTINASTIAGTSVYLDPEYKRTGKLKKESDVYSFGVVLFEILSGRLAYDPIYLEENGNGIAPIARRHFDEGTLKEMVDPQMKEADEFISNLYYGPNQDSLDTFSKIAYRCLAKSQAERPTIEDIIKELQNALNFQENRKDTLKISLVDIKMGTENFSDKNCIIRGAFGRAYNGKVQYDNKLKDVIVKRFNRCSQEDDFLTEIEILFKHKHENVIDLVGYCKEENEKIIVYKHASIGSLDMHLSNVILGWAERLKICIDVASALDFLHKGGQGQEVVIHRDIKSASILLNGDWGARISDFGLSLVAPINKKIDDYVINDVFSTPGYCDPSFSETSFLTKESDIYSLGVVLFEILCGKLTVENYNNEGQFLDDVVKDGSEERELDEIVFEGIKQQIVPQSLVTFQLIAYECLHHKRENRPTACEVVVQLKKALEFQEEYEKWEPKLPKDYKQILDMSKSREIYSTTNKKDLYNMLSKGILIQEGRVWFLLGNDGERIEMLSSRMFSYKNRRSRKWRSVSESRFHNKVAEMSDISHLKIRIKRKIQSVSPGFNYRVHLVFKFCGPRKSPAKRMYVNLKYKKGSENLHTYFATWREDGWMMIELCRFSTHKGDVDFEVLLESFSPCESGSRAIYIEGIEFQAIDNVKHEEIKKLKEVQQVFKSNSKMDMVQQLPNNNSEEPSKTSDNYDEGEKLISLSEVSGKKRLMLLAKEVLYDSSSVKLFHLMQSTQSRFEEEIKLLPRQVFHIKCKIESQMLSPCTDYACYLVFKLSEYCGALHCPVKIRDLLHWKNKEDKIIFFRSPNPLNQHDANLVPEQREDGLTEVNVWKFNSNEELRENFVPMNFKLIAYEGTMSGLIVYGLEVRPIL